MTAGSASGIQQGQVDARPCQQGLVLEAASFSMRGMRWRVLRQETSWLSAARRLRRAASWHRQGEGVLGHIGQQYCGLVDLEGEDGAGSSQDEQLEGGHQ
jgi:hypothetical protein